MVKGEFYTRKIKRGGDFAAKVSGYIDKGRGIGYYKEEMIAGPIWYAIDLQTGRSGATAITKKAAQNALMAFWPKLAEYRMTEEYREQCEVFRRKIAEAEGNQDGD